MLRTITTTITCPVCKYKYIVKTKSEPRDMPENNRNTSYEVISREVLEGDEPFKDYDVGDDYEAIIVYACPKCGVLLLPKCIRKREEKIE